MILHKWETVRIRVHQLVTKIFLEPDCYPKERCNVNHIDEDNKNNHFSNLRGVTNSENCNFYHNQRKKGSSQF